MGGVALLRDKRSLNNIMNGETEDIDKLINRYYDEIYVYCYCHLENKYMAQDITQDVFLKLFQNLNTYIHVGKLKNYLYVIAKNTIKDYLKKRKEIYVDEIEKYSTNNIEDVDRVIVVQNVVKQLNDQERELIILRYYQNLRYSDIAKILSMPVSSVRYNVKQVEKKMKEKMKGLDI
jgi:RNA polymerase sigma-70 factor (ECF subfamily)